MKKFILSAFLVLLMVFNFSYANDESTVNSSQEYKEAKLLDRYKNIAQRDNKKLCIKTKVKEVCFVDQGMEGGDGKQRYSFTELLTNNIAIVRMDGYEEYDDYFISLETGNIVLVLPPIFLGETQISLSPNKDFLLVVTTNNGYDGNPEVSQVDIYELVENKQIKHDLNDEVETYNIWPHKFNIYFKDTVTGFKKYNITWMNDTTVKVQANKPQKDYIIFHKKEGIWEVDEKSYDLWSDYDENEGL